MSESQAHEHSPLCHHIERELVISEVSVKVTLILDGDEQRIAQIINALNSLRDSSEAA